MRKRTKILAVVVCTVCAVLALVKLTGEPSYKGVSLTKWVTVYRDSSHRFSGDEHEWMIWRPGREDPEAKAAADAVRAIHAQALPLLVRWISYRPASWKTDLFNFAAKLPGPLKKIRTMNWLNPAYDHWRVELALSGFAILGSNAAPAIPALTEVAEDPTAPGRLHAVMALFQLGPPAVPALTNILAGAYPAWLKEGITIGIGRMGADAQAAIPALIRDLASSDEMVARRSAVALGGIGQQPELVVPALVGALDDQRDSVRHGAAFALQKYGDAARPAVPKLQTLLLSDTSSTQEVARRTLQAIAPEALTNGPSHSAADP